MAANNQGIQHLYLNGKILCGNRRAHTHTNAEGFKQYPDAQCKKCAAKFARIEAIEQRRQSKQPN